MDSKLDTIVILTFDEHRIQMLTTSDMAQNVDNAIKALAQQGVEFEYEENYKTLYYPYSEVTITLEKNNEYVKAFQLIHPEGVSTYSCDGFLAVILDHYQHIGEINAKIVCDLCECKGQNQPFTECEFCGFMLCDVCAQKGCPCSK